MGQRLLQTLLCLTLAAALLAVGQQSPAQAAGPAWWNASYSHRLAVNVYANDAITAGYSLDVVFNHQQMVGQGASLSSGDDVRIAYFNGTSWTELDRVLGYGSSWNNPSTDIVFKTVNAISGNTNDSGYYLYYGNPGAITPPTNANNVYVLWDDFSSGTIDSNKWNVDLAPGISVEATTGALRILGSTDSSTQNSLVGLRWISGTNGEYRFDTSVAIVAQNAAAATWKAQLGSRSLSVKSGTFDKRVQYWNPGWTEVGDSTLDGATFGYRRVSQTSSISRDQHFEDGVLKAQRMASGFYTPSFRYAADSPGATFDVRFDDIVIRKFVTYEPKVTIEQPTDVKFATDVAAIFSFAVAPHTGSCNGATPTAGVTATASAISFGRINSASPAIGAQDLTVATNSRSGFSVKARSAGLLSNGTQNIPNVSATNASPAAFPSGAGFGYTTSGLPRFTNGFAGFESAGLEVQAGSGPSNATSCIALKVQADAATTAGAYSTTVIFTAVLTF